MRTLVLGAVYVLAGLAFVGPPGAEHVATGTEGVKPVPPARFEIKKEWQGRPFVEIATDAAAPAWSPDGRRIAYIRQERSQGPQNPQGPFTGIPTPVYTDNSVVILDLDTGAERTAPLNEKALARVELLLWAPDDKTVFAADRKRLWLVRMTDKDATVRLMLDSFADGDFRGLALASDQKHLVLRYEPDVGNPNDFAWKATKFVVLDLEGKEVARGSGKDGSWGFRFSANECFAATARQGYKARDGYVWGVLPLARSADGAEIVVVQEEPGKASLLPMSDGLRAELVSWTGKSGRDAFRKLDMFVCDSQRGTAVEHRAAGRGDKVLRVRREGFFTMWGGSRTGTYGVRGKEEKAWASLLDPASGKFGLETQLPLPKSEVEATYRPHYELMDVDAGGRSAAFWFYFNYRGDPADKKWSGLAVLDLPTGACRTVFLHDGLSVDRLNPPRLEPQGRLLLLPWAGKVWLCDVEGK